MKPAYLSKLTWSLAAALLLCGLAAAQDNSSGSTQSNSANKKPANSKPGNAKPKKTWTEDDLSALHSPADSYRDRQQAQKAQEAAAAAQPASGSTEASHDKPPLLSDPKTVESADKMIAWEERDIAAQEEFVARLKTQLETAGPEERDHLEKLIIERQKIIEDTRKERDGLVAQKKGLEKKQAASAAPSPAQPPQ